MNVEANRVQFFARVRKSERADVESGTRRSGNGRGGDGGQSGARGGADGENRDCGKGGVSSVVIAPADPAAKIEIVNAGTVAELTAEGAPSSDNTVIFNENAGNIIVNNVSDVSVGTITTE